MDTTASLGRLVAGQDDARLSPGFDRTAAELYILTALSPHLSSAQRRAFPEETEVADLAHNLNADRNAALLEELEHVALALNAHGIIPVVFKGTAHILTGLWPTSGSRFVTDIDLLVSRPDLAQAYSTVSELTKEPSCLAVEDVAHPKHVPRIRRADWPAAIELHFSVIGTQFDHVLHPLDVIERSRELWCGQSRVAVPDDADSLAIALFHSPLGHEKSWWFRERLRMRDILDMAFLLSNDDDHLALRAMKTRLAETGGEPVVTWSKLILRRTTGVVMPCRDAPLPMRALAAIMLIPFERPIIYRILLFVRRWMGFVPRVAGLSFRLLTDSATRRRFSAKISSKRFLSELVDFYFLGR